MKDKELFERVRAAQMTRPGPELLAELAEAALRWCEAKAHDTDVQAAEDDLVIATMAYWRKLSEKKKGRASSG